MAITIAFDVYGTLIDTHGIVEILRQVMGDKARAFSQTWRDKQLEYSFRRGLMQNYQPFSVCTRNALDYTCLFYGISMDEIQKQNLMASYRKLPAFSDVLLGLQQLQQKGIRLFAFSNGSVSDVEELLVSASIRDIFEGVISCEDLESFKPNPAVYHYFLTQANASASEAWLVSSNPFDVTGAISAGMQAVWVQRSKQAIFDPWDIQPDAIIASLSELSERF